MQPTFDPTVTWGTVISILTFIVTTVIFYTRLVARIESRMTRMEIKLNLMWSTWRRDHQVRPQEDEQFFSGG